MAEGDPRDTRTARRRGDTQPTDRLDEGQPTHGEPVDPDWRRSRARGRSRRTQALPGSRKEFSFWLKQDFLTWLQFGGWRVVLAAVVLVGVTVWLIWLTSRPEGAASPFARATDALTSSGTGASTLPQQATVTPRPTSAAPTAAPAGADGAQFQVINTGAEGLFLRPDHSTAGAPIKTLPDGAVVTVVGPDFSGPDRVWKNVRDADGSTGWVAADYLQAVQ